MRAQRGGSCRLMRRFHLHLVSDATGETCITIARAAAAQFQGVDAVEHLWSLVRTESQLRHVLAHVEAEPGVVMFTLVDPQLQALLHEECRRIEVPCIPLLDTAISALSAFLGIESRNQPGRQHIMDEAYLTRIEAMNYALAHDDGHSPTSLREADIVLVGVSRTSKTPTCFYLANRGLKAANVPVVPGSPLPSELAAPKGALVVGLTCHPEQLIDIRRSRMRHDWRYRRDRLCGSPPGRGGGSAGAALVRRGRMAGDRRDPPLDRGDGRRNSSAIRPSRPLPLSGWRGAGSVYSAARQERAGTGRRSHGYG